MSTKTQTTIELREWLAEGELLFGPNRRYWRFVCPTCGHIAAAEDWRLAGAPDTSAAISCVRWWNASLGQCPSNAENPVEIVTHGEEPRRAFDFDRSPGRAWRDERGRLVFVHGGIGGGAWAAYWRKPNGSLKRLTSNRWPTFDCCAAAQANLDREALRRGWTVQEIA